MTQNRVQTIAEQICDFLAQEILADKHMPKPSDGLEALGIDSYALMQIVLFLERQFGVKLPFEVLTPEATQSIESLAKALEPLTASR